MEDLAAALAGVAPTAPVDERAERLVSAVVSTLAARPVFCDLISAQASVLERNISTETALAFKRAAAIAFERMIEVVVGALPELGAEGSGRFIAAASMLAGAIWTHSHPVPAVVAAYEADPSLGTIRMEFEPALRDNLWLLLRGALPRLTQ